MVGIHLKKYRETTMKNKIKYIITNNINVLHKYSGMQSFQRQSDSLSSFIK